MGFGTDWIPDSAQPAIGFMSPLGQVVFNDGGISMVMGKQGIPTPNPAKIVAALVDKLLEQGFSERDWKKFLGGNFYRVFRQVWR